MSKKLQSVLNEISRFNNDEINQVVEAIKLRRTYISRQSVFSFNVGDKVQFDAGNRGIITGTITKKAIKNITVDTGRGTWRVSANLLKKVA